MVVARYTGTPMVLVTETVSPTPASRPTSRSGQSKSVERGNAVKVNRSHTMAQELKKREERRTGMFILIGSTIIFIVCESIKVRERALGIEKNTKTD